MTANDVYKILQYTYQLVYDGEWWNMTGFNEEECFLEHCEDGDEMCVSLNDLAKAQVDYYKLVPISDEEIAKLTGKKKKK